MTCLYLDDPERSIPTGLLNESAIPMHETWPQKRHRRRRVRRFGAQRANGFLIEKFFGFDIVQVVCVVTNKKRDGKNVETIERFSVRKIVHLAPNVQHFTKCFLNLKLHCDRHIISI